MSFFSELKRRNVFRVGIAYALVAWVVLQVVDFLTELIGAPDWVLQVFFIAAAIGLLAAVIFSWVFEMTPEGIKREKEVDRSTSITPETGRKLDRIIIVFLAVAVVFLLARPYWQAPPATVEGDAVATGVATETARPATAATAEKSVAVLPFVPLSSGEDDEFFADGMTEEILNALAQLPELLVTARTSSFSFKGQDTPVNEIAALLGVQHVVEGSVRRSGDRIRVTAQLIRAEDSFHLWSETYDSTSADTIAVQEDIAEQIATALDVVLDEKRREAMRTAGLRDPTAFIAFQRGIKASAEAHGAFDQIGGLLAANRYFETVLERVPDYAPAYIESADAYVHVINDTATVEPTMEGVPADIRQNAFDLAVRKLTLAREHARNLGERSTIEFDLAVITGDFYRILPRLEGYLESDHCDIGQWVDPMATVFGYAAQLVDRLEPVIQCNPLGATRRFSQARAAIWAGEPERALELIAEAREKVDHPWLDAAQIDALIAAGRYETAEQEIRRSQTDPFYLFISGAKLAGVRGDLEAAERLHRAVAAEFSGSGEIRSGFLMLQYLAFTGQREEANRWAADIDARAYGPLPLILVTMWCGCGAPFDLEATPNFAAKIEQGGLIWPPTPTAEFPLKDW
jgi:adenylate cyclase